MQMQIQMLMQIQTQMTYDNVTTVILNSSAVLLPSFIIKREIAIIIAIILLSKQPQSSNMF